MTKTKSTNRLTHDQVALAKALLDRAERVVTMAPGEINRISEQTGIKRDNLLKIAYGRAHQDVAPMELSA
jgi:hypothetical protein